MSEEGIGTPPLDRTTRALLAITAVAGLLLAFTAAVTGSALLASVSAVASATAAAIAVGVARRASKAVATTATPKPSAAAPAPPASGTPPPVIPTSKANQPDGRDLDSAVSSPTPTPANANALPSIEIDDVLSNLIETMAPAGTVVSAHMWLLDPATDSFRLMRALGQLPPAALPVPRQDTVLGRAIDEENQVVSPLERRRGPTGDASYWRLSIPLYVGQTAGVAAVDFETDLEPDRSFITFAARQARGTLIAAFAAQIGRREIEAAHQLMEAAQDLSRVVEPSHAVEALLTRAVAMFVADTGSVMLADEAGTALTIAAARGLTAKIVEDTCVPKGEGIAGMVFATGESLVVEDLPGGTRSSRRHGVRSAISVPICDAEGCLGVLNVGNRAYSTVLSQTALSALESLGQLGAEALRHARAVSTAGDLYFDTLKTLALALETRDPCSHGGTERIVGCAAALGQAMGLDGEESRALETAALLHDIGMIATGDASGVRKRPLTTVEWGLLKMHPVVAAELLQQAPTLRDVAPIVYHHHEHYDGSGYAAGVAGEDIPLPARILSVADAFVAMTSDRPYRNAMQVEAALAELDKEAGAQFDPHVVAALHDVLEADRSPAPAWCA